MSAGGISGLPALPPPLLIVIGGMVVMNSTSYRSQIGLFRLASLGTNAQSKVLQKGSHVCVDDQIHG